MNIEMLNGYVLIKPESKPEKTASGIYIPETTTTSNPIGTIVKGTNENRKVVYKGTDAMEVDIDNTKYVIVNEKDIILLFN